MNYAVGEFDVGDGVKFYCRKCFEELTVLDEECWEVDESLVFCNSEWERQS